ncbi:MAG: peptidoglycan editing factor PgeF [Deltaproteobacteria bacterium]|nr:peptidoglycan editing factor PgeF [Deltaproteobacteria bacterium]
MTWRIDAFADAALPVRGAFFGRLGGTSAAPCDSLNLGIRCGDDADAVRLNENFVLASMGVRALYMPDQVHGCDVSIVESEPISGVVRGVAADAAVITRPGIAVGVLTADCVPVLIGDARGRAAAAVHAGWRGLDGGIIAATVAALSRMGVAPGDLRASVGPGIGPCHFEVSPDLAGRFRSEVAGADNAVARAGERDVIDLALVAFRQLVLTGIDSAHVEVVRRCTACEPGVFFSHRRERGVTGRQLSATWIAGR